MAMANIKKTWIRCCIIGFGVIFSLYGQTTLPVLNQTQLVSAIRPPFSFAIIGDRTGEGPDPWTVFDEAIRDINQRRPDFAVMIGDIIQGGARTSIALETRWQEAVAHLDSLRVPLYMIPGNHDIWSQATYQAWKEKIGDSYFSFTCGTVLFLFLNSEESYSGSGSGLGRAQIDFVTSALNQHADASQIFIFMHRPPWLETGPLKKQWEDVETLLQGKRFSLITGHLHILGETQKQGNRYLVVGPTGGKMRLARNPDLGMMQHFTWVDVRPDTSYFQFIENKTSYPEQKALEVYARGVVGLKYLLRQ